ncbi:KTSC domain-containing protein [Neorhizobium lilium]|uniref:KTSC domain-containing protein n=1 Tax=Neorhizobium lilium TaxID=2503024 RepID=A0A444LDB7_9HYPH|nr:KTSC domain-containing protein [Neorhizobium lilium]RWX75757.1 KTSC domain-containing protein [Neorhizobium lilium]
MTIRVELRSKLVEAASYEDAAQLMRVYLTNGQMRDYVEVPRTVFEQLVGARSAGHYFMEHIRGRFRHPD